MVSSNVIWWTSRSVKFWEICAIIIVKELWKTYEFSESFKEEITVLLNLFVFCADMWKREAENGDGKREGRIGQMER